VLRRLPFMNGEHSQLCRICGIEKQNRRQDKAKGARNVKGEEKEQGEEGVHACECSVLES
jgi:hypothetical protein